MSNLVRGALPRGTPQQTRSRGPHDPRSARVAHSLALVRVSPKGITPAIVMTIVMLVAGSSTAFACPVCFGAEETSMIDGAKLGVLVMLGVLFAVQAGFLGFFLYLRKRAKENADIELDLEWSELQRGSRTS